MGRKRLFFRVGRTVLAGYFFFLVFGAPVLRAEDSSSGNRVAIVKSRSLAPYLEAYEGIEESLEASGQAVVIDAYDLDGKLDKGPGIAELIAKSGAKIVFGVGTEAAQALQGRLGKTPLVLAMVYDPLGEGLIAPEERSNVYGAYLKVSFEKRFSVLKKVLPSFDSYALIHRKGEKAEVVKEAKEASALAGTKLIDIEIDALDRFPEAIKKAGQSSQALLMILDQELYNKTTTKELLLLSVQKKYPVIALSSNYVQAGALLCVSAGFKENGMTAGKLGVQLLRGEALSQHFIPTERTEISLNSHIARLFEITLSSWEGPVHEIS